MTISRQIAASDMLPLGNFTATTDPGASNDNTQGYGAGSWWLNTATGVMWRCRSAATSAAVWTAVELSDHPGYIVNNWYLPYALTSFVASIAPGANSIRLFPAFIKHRVTISALGLRVATLSAGGNVQVAIYANNPATGRPTGTALVSTASMSTAAVANVNAAASVQLEPGLYWFATNCDNGTATFAGAAASTVYVGAVIGSATQGNDLLGTQTLLGLSVAQTFGTWPDLTSASFTEVLTSGSVPLPQFKVGSVP